MSRNPSPQQIAQITQRVTHAEQRVAQLEAKRRAGLPLTAPAPHAPAYAQSVTAPNGYFQLGNDSGWLLVDYISPGGTLGVETTAPLDGQTSGRVDEGANGMSRIAWLPTGNSGSPTVGTDVFSTQPGDVWQLTASIQCSVARPHAQILALAGVTAADCFFGLFSARSLLVADDEPLTAGVMAILQGTVTIPANRNYVGFAVGAEPLTGTAPTIAWSWLFDTVSMARLLT